MLKWNETLCWSFDKVYASETCFCCIGKKLLCLLRLFYVCVPDVMQVLGTKCVFYIASAFWCLWQFDQSTVQTAILITYHGLVLSVVLKALISLLDRVSQGKCCCDAAGGILSCSFVSAFGINLRTAVYACQPRCGKISCMSFCRYKASNATSICCDFVTCRLGTILVLCSCTATALHISHYIVFK